MKWQRLLILLGGVAVMLTATSDALRAQDVPAIVIQGGTLIDGLRPPRFVADVGIRDGRIARIYAGANEVMKDLISRSL